MSVITSLPSGAGRDPTLWAELAHGVVIIVVVALAAYGLHALWTVATSWRRR